MANIDYEGPACFRAPVERFYEEHSGDYCRDGPVRISIEAPVGRYVRFVDELEARNEVNRRLDRLLGLSASTGGVSKRGLHRLILFSGFDDKLHTGEVGRGTFAHYSPFFDQIIVPPLLVFYKMMNMRQKKKMKKDELFQILAEWGSLEDTLAHESVHWSLGDYCGEKERRKLFEPVEKVALDFIAMQNVTLTEDGRERLNAFFPMNMPSSAKECDEVIKHYVESIQGSSRSLFIKTQELGLLVSGEAAAYNFEEESDEFLIWVKKEEYPLDKAKMLYSTISRWIDDIGKRETLVRLKQLMNAAWEQETPIYELISEN